MFGHSDDSPELDGLEDLLMQGSDRGTGPVWYPSDCYFDPEDPYNPCGPHHRGPGFPGSGRENSNGADTDSV